MNSSISNRRGSALLVVLGMLSFMLFSGIAFSVYMRYTRMPTSFLRRTAMTRQLTKAALAEAIEEVDRAIGNNPHPGIGANVENIGGTRKQNVWSHRVFIGAGSTGNGSTGSSSEVQSGGYYPSYASTGDTVPTLTLEGLAYLPPNLINEARYFSQKTPTAKWQKFWFDSGRYAYTAIDVSDYFDINRMSCDVPRAACGSRRISLAHIFEKPNHRSLDSGSAEAWTKKMETARSIDDSDRISIDDPWTLTLASFNLKWGTEGIGSLKCPFFGFVCGSGKSNAQDGNPYPGCESADDSAADVFRCMTFVTDSYSTAQKEKTSADSTTGSKGVTIKDLETTQPFKSDMFQSQQRSLIDITEESSELLDGEDYFNGRLSLLTRFALWDYLDANKVPASLAIPTCEQVPMICGIAPSIGTMRFAISKEDADAKEEIEGDIVWKSINRKYYLDLTGVKQALMGVDTRVALAYPFLLRGEKAKTASGPGGKGSNDKFSVDGRIALFITRDSSTSGADELSARPNTPIEGLYLKDKNDIENFSLVNKSVIVCPVKGLQNNFEPDSVTTSSSEEGAVDGKIPVLDMPMACRGSSSVPDKALLVSVPYRWKYQQIVDGQRKTLQPEPTQDNINGKPDTTGAEFGFLTKDGKLDTNYNFLEKGGSSANATVRIAVMARVTNSKGETVDLAPACFNDDKNLNSIDNSDLTSRLHDSAAPYISFSPGMVVLSFSGFDEGQIGEVEAKGRFLTGDPRYNHAPENWYRQVSDSNEGLAEEWYREERADAASKDGDIWMATSDQGYLQSIYELAFLPRLQNSLSPQGVGDGFYGKYDVSNNGKMGAGKASLKDRNRMWTTYDAIGEDFDELGDGRIVSGNRGLKVNPYSDSTDVLMAAFANTPLNWRYASTNNAENVAGDLDEFLSNYAWNEYSSGEQGKACLTYDTLEDLADKFKAAVRSDGDWETAWVNLGWDFRQPTRLCGLDLDTRCSKLFSVDKKYLYGFWHDCFAARQQLFIFFVRAEPMMMGGGVNGQTPPQLGSRAVAVVWRDPAKSGTTNIEGEEYAKPHQTRILFYHQFD